MNYRLMMLAAYSLLMFIPTAALARTISFELRNRTSETAYVVTAFASDLIPNFRNLTSTPLIAGATRRVTIFDDYEKCIFDFSVDFNPLPRPGRKPSMQRKPFRVFHNIDICRKNSLDLK